MEFEQRVKDVCTVYLEANELSANGTHVICTDEKMGIQARESIRPMKPAKPGKPALYEAEYTRHGTSGLIASRDVVTGKIIAPLIQPTRKEDDFVKHIEAVINCDPDANYIFIMDQLNTHKSESMVRLVAEKCQIAQETLGIKGKKGILKTMQSRQKFLEDDSKRIRIVYTPKHSSWLNQIEMWFSILTRRVLTKRANFSSVQNLEGSIFDFILHYNEHLAKAFKWTYAGKLLQA